MSTRTENQSARPALDGVAGARILIVEARFYTDLADTLAAGAERELAKYNCVVERAGVPGAFEIPGVVALAAGKYDGFVTLGCVIRGETTHYDYVCGESARGLMNLSTFDGLAIGYGILTVENLEQAEVRADPARGDKGGESTRAALAMVAIKRRFAGGQR